MWNIVNFYSILSSLFRLNSYAQNPADNVIFFTCNIRLSDQKWKVIVTCTEEERSLSFLISPSQCFRNIHTYQIAAICILYSQLHQPVFILTPPNYSFLLKYVLAVLHNLHYYYLILSQYIFLRTWNHRLQPKKLHSSVEVLPAPVRVPSQRPLAPSFTSVR